jgi:hypothetical protein
MRNAKHKAKEKIPSPNIAGSQINRFMEYLRGG